MFTKQEKSVLDLISGHQVLLKKRLVQQCDSLTSAKKDLVSPKTIIDQRILNINAKVQSLEKELSSTKEENSQKISGSPR